MTRVVTWIGIDVSKQSLVGAGSDQQRAWSVPNTGDGVQQLVHRLRTLRPVQVVREATGQWHLALCDALSEADLPYTQVDGYTMRNFARSQGRRAKTDPVDARMLASYGVLVQPEPTRPRSPGVRALTALVQRREVLLPIAPARRTAANRRRLQR